MQSTDSKPTLHENSGSGGSCGGILGVGGIGMSSGLGGNFTNTTTSGLTPAGGKLHCN